MTIEKSMDSDKNVCPKCGKPLSEIVTTPTGRKLRRCSGGSWDPETKTTQGCNYVLWLAVEPQPLDEKCPKCGAPLVLAVTRFGKKMKKCSKGGWDKEKREATGCDYVEWITGTSQPLDEKCPTCNSPLVLYTTANGKKMKKCSTSGWDREKRQATGCQYVYWFKPGELPTGPTGEENLPPEP
jgi:ssDNA-binding Zn-finger/Zn-ribbon topoisomerase 1